MPSAASPETPATAVPPQSAAEQLMGAARDTTGQQATPPDSSTIQRFSAEVSEATRLLMRGEWDLLWQRVYAVTIDFFVGFVPRLVQALIVLELLCLVYRGVQIVLFRLLDRSQRVDAGLQSVLLKVYRFVASVLIAVLVLDQIFDSVTGLVAGLSIAGIAIGFAARDSLENFISGVIIMMDKPFRMGDNVEVDGQFGTVEDITLRSTRMRTLNNEVIVMPNTQMINQKLLNHTMKDMLRVEIFFGIAYKERPQEAREVVLKEAEGDDRWHPDYEPSVIVTEMGDSSVNMRLRLFLKNPKQEVPVRWEYTEKVREALREADIEIPFPHLQLFVDETKAFEGAPWMPASGRRTTSGGGPPKQLDDGSPAEGRQTADD
ncbi:MAG: mechanosensitive ion channel family protein [Bacteroidetes bacterium QH_8_67_23]|nr:MAG: mechanosensitive ion channel family protein [Bacteroidetes bacterium QH_8_67_23]